VDWEAAWVEMSTGGGRCDRTPQLMRRSDARAAAEAFQFFAGEEIILPYVGPPRHRETILSCSLIIRFAGGASQFTTGASNKGHRVLKQRVFWDHVPRRAMRRRPGFNQQEPIRQRRFGHSYPADPGGSEAALDRPSALQARASVAVHILQSESQGLRSRKTRGTVEQVQYVRPRRMNRRRRADGWFAACQVGKNEAKSRNFAASVPRTLHPALGTANRP